MSQAGCPQGRPASFILDEVSKASAARGAIRGFSVREGSRQLWCSTRFRPGEDSGFDSYSRHESPPGGIGPLTGLRARRKLG